MAAIAAHGLDVTVDQVAEAAGVSRRTVFRQFATQGELVATAVTKIIDTLVRRYPEPPAPGTDVRAWLRTTAVTVHQVVRELVGRAFWDVHIDRPDRSSEVTAALGDVASLRSALDSTLAVGAWRELGGTGEPPPWVVEAFSLQLSTFATNVLAAHSAEGAGEICAQILWAVLTDALALAHSEGDGTAT